MTYKEYITGSLEKFDVAESTVDILLLNQGIDGADSVDVRTAKKAMYNEIALVIPVANIQEDGFTRNNDYNAIKAWYGALARELGLPDQLSGMTYVGDQW